MDVCFFDVFYDVIDDYFVGVIGEGVYVYFNGIFQKFVN